MCVNYSEAKKYSQIAAIIDAVNDINVPLTFKLHPVGEENSREYLEGYIDTVSSGAIQIVSERKLSEVIDGFDVFIVDFLQSQVIADIFVLDVPVILVDFDFQAYALKEQVRKDLAKRCYIASNIEEFREYLFMYKQGVLKSKLDEQFLDDYYFNPSGPMPVDSIKALLHSVSV